MTPTEQDNELREKIHSALFADDFPILNDIEKDAVDRVVAIIQAQKAEAERREREARLNEVQSAYEYWINGRKFISSYFRDRIAELSKLTEVK